MGFSLLDNIHTIGSRTKYSCVRYSSVILQCRLFQIQPDLLSVDAGAIGKVNVKTLQEKMEEKAKLLVMLAL
jgi:hypothetical protein